MTRAVFLIFIVATLLVDVPAASGQAAVPPPGAPKQPPNQAPEKQAQRRAGRKPRHAAEPAKPAQPILPAWAEPVLRTLAGVGVFYACVLATMALVGLVIAFRTRGHGALRFLGEDPVELTAGGQVVRVRGEAGFTRIYALTLVLGLVLFYVSVPFVLLALMGLAGLLIYFLLKGKKFTGKGVALIVGGAGGMAWAILRSLMPRAGELPAGRPLTAVDAPRLYQVLRELAYRMDTDPVAEVHLAAGPVLAVQQEGRGLFGLFGTSRRALLLGYSSLLFLTVSELKALLAHEHAHFSQRDTFFSRLIYRVTDSIEQALRGMREAGGKLNYVNPFYFFLYLYYRAYLLLATGFTRSREFLADRLASTLYGSNLLGSGLTKVETDAVLHDRAVRKLVKQRRRLGNVFEEARKVRPGTAWADHSDRSFIRLLKRRASFFAGQPGYRERIEALAALPRSHDADPTPAVQLLDNLPALEAELTELLTRVATAKSQEAEKTASSPSTAAPVARSVAQAE